MSFLGNARAQATVDVHDPNRTSLLDHEKAGDRPLVLYAVHFAERFGGERLSPMVRGGPVMTSAAVASSRSGFMCRRKSP